MTVFGTAEGYLEDNPDYRVLASGMQLAEGWLLVQSGSGKYVQIDRWWYQFWGPKSEEFSKKSLKGQRAVMHGELSLNQRGDSYAYSTGKIVVKAVSVAAPLEMNVDEWKPRAPVAESFAAPPDSDIPF